MTIERIKMLLTKLRRPYEGVSDPYLLQIAYTYYYYLLPKVLKGASSFYYPQILSNIINYPL